MHCAAACRNFFRLQQQDTAMHVLGQSTLNACCISWLVTKAHGLARNALFNQVLIACPHSSPKCHT